MGIFKEIYLMLKERKKFWLAPIIIVLLLISIFAIFAQTAIFPFIYVIF